MPELPEVETIRRDLNTKIVHKKISFVRITHQRTMPGNVTPAVKLLTGNTIRKVERRGKLLIMPLRLGRKSLLIHLKMTGQLIFKTVLRGKTKIIVGGHSFSDFAVDRHNGAQLFFADGSVLYFNDARRFGYMKVVGEEEKKKIVATLGLEPLEKKFTAKILVALLGKRRVNVKAFLLNQQFIAGIGNIYADEICHAAQILPTRSVFSLKRAEVVTLYHCIKSILNKAVRYRGTTFNSYVDSAGRQGQFSKRLRVYGRKGEQCISCQKNGILNSSIHKSVVAGRGTHYCLICQK